jgi:NAD(P)H-hydrate repair Nnr-like enzyme with NAD(P)H-hydrate dehydratase domain
MELKVYLLHYLATFIYLFVRVVFECNTEGGLKRMGGQGDILSGVIAAFLAWGNAYEQGVWRYEN